MDNNNNNSIKQDTVVESIVEQFRERSRIGIQKYGTTLDRKDLNLFDWSEHLKQELMDAILYVQRLQNEILFVEKQLERMKTDNHNQTKRRYGWHF